MRLPPYKNYQQPNSDWQGEVPSGWNSIALGRLFRRVKRTGFENEELLSVYRDHGVIPTSSRDDNHNKPSDDLSPYQLVQPGELVMNKMKAWQGSIAISEHRGIVSPAYFVYEPWKASDERMHSRYVHYLLRSPIYIAQYLRQSKGIRVSQWDLDPQQFERIEILLPNREEQKKIAAFLDYETAKIDALIEKQQQLIALLGEKRQAVISHAVTKGLNPDAPMRDSGVEWLGEVPEHWTVCKCGFYLSVLSGFAFPSSGFSDDENDTRLLRGINVSVSCIRWDETVRWKRRTGDRLDEYEMAVGDLVIGMDRPIISDGIRVSKIREEDVPSLLLQRVASIKPGPNLSSDFLMQIMSSPMFAAHIEPDTTGVSVPHISPSQIADFVIAMPPIEEQGRIASVLDEKLSKFDLLMSSCEDAVELLQERRTALISAAVTGKIDVRGWKRPSSDNPLETEMEVA